MREAVYHAQNWGQIGNMPATWRREVPDRDFPAGCSFSPLDTGVFTHEDLARLAGEEIVARIEASDIEASLLAECRDHRDRMHVLIGRCRSLDLHSYARGVESGFAMTLAAKGYI